MVTKFQRINANEANLLIFIVDLVVRFFILIIIHDSYQGTEVDSILLIKIHELTIIKCECF